MCAKKGRRRRRGRVVRARNLETETNAVSANVDHAISGVANVVDVVVVEGTTATGTAAAAVAAAAAATVAEIGAGTRPRPGTGELGRKSSVDANGKGATADETTVRPRVAERWTTVRLACARRTGDDANATRRETETADTTPETIEDATTADRTTTTAARTTADRTTDVTT